MVLNYQKGLSDVGKKQSKQEGSPNVGLGGRERQIYETVLRLGNASVSEILSELSDAPAYDTVRTVARTLETKGYLKHREEGNKYIYSASQPASSVSRSAVQHLIETFFKGSTLDTVAAILDVSAKKLSSEELAQLEALIEKAKK